MTVGVSDQLIFLIIGQSKKIYRTRSAFGIMSSGYKG
jgi:hypothetical protein